jgi:hypothetical protein
MKKTKSTEKFRTCHLCHKKINGVGKHVFGRHGNLPEYGGKRLCHYVSSEGKVSCGRWLCNDCYGEVHKYVDWEVITNKYIMDE